jgi:hypothetical protein
MSDNLDSKLEITENDAPADTPVKDGVKGTIEVPYPALKDYFNVDEVTDGQKDKFEVIWKYFGDEADGVGDLLYKMRQLENRLGSPAIGESRLTKMYNYVKISAQIKDAEKQRDSLLRK